MFYRITIEELDAALEQAQHQLEHHLADEVAEEGESEQMRQHQKGWLAALQHVRKLIYGEETPTADMSPSAEEEIARLGWVRVTLLEPHDDKPAGTTYDAQVTSYRGHTPMLNGYTYRHCTFTLNLGNYREAEFDTANSHIRIEALHETHAADTEEGELPDAKRLLQQFTRQFPGFSEQG